MFAYMTQRENICKQEMFSKISKPAVMLPLVDGELDAAVDAAAHALVLHPVVDHP